MLNDEIYRTILESIEKGVYVVGADFRIAYCNQSGTELLGVMGEEIIGQNLFRVFPGVTPEASTFSRVFSTGQPILNKQVSFMTFKGELKTTMTSTIPLFQDEHIIGAFEVFTDISKVRDLASQVADLQARLRRAGSKGERVADSGARFTLDDLVGDHSSMRTLRQRGMRAAGSDSPVLIYGETGTGKELLTQGIHNASPRRSGPFIAQNCAALPDTLLEGILFGTTRGGFTGAEDRPGLFELANGGTLMLDELNSASLDLQAKLLRVLQDGLVRRVGDSKVRPLDVRVIACVNIPAEQAVQQRLLRRDLYYRLNVISLQIPPLRERHSDIPMLVGHVVGQLNRRMGIHARGVSPAVLTRFLQYDWPGNVRELQHVIEGAVYLMEGDEVQLEDLPATILREPRPDAELTESDAGSVTPLRTALKDVERRLVIRALKQSGGSITRAADLLAMPRQTLNHRIKALGLQGIQRAVVIPGEE